jgi:hypothetical protein
VQSAWMVKAASFLAAQDLDQVPVDSAVLCYPLQVGTTDGRVRLLGKPGLERTVYSACSQAYGTVHLEFLLNRSLLVRLSEVGLLPCM